MRKFHFSQVFWGRSVWPNVGLKRLSPAQRQAYGLSWLLSMCILNLLEGLRSGFLRFVQTGAAWQEVGNALVCLRVQLTNAYLTLLGDSFHL